MHNYYEGVLQIRNPNQELENFLMNQLRKEKVAISKKITHKQGYDLFLTSQRFTLALGRRLNKAFRGKLTVSRRIHTRKRITSKDVYRVTVLFRNG